MSLKLLAVNGSVTRHSRTGTLLRTVLDGAAKAHPEIETELLELAEYRLDFCDVRDPWAYAGDTAEVIRKVVEADALIVGTPVTGVVCGRTACAAASSAGEDKQEFHPIRVKGRVKDTSQGRSFHALMRAPRFGGAAAREITDGRQETWNTGGWDRRSWK